MGELTDLLHGYSASNAIRFHMPAHNGTPLGITSDMDITELSFSDNMIEPDNVIARLENDIATVYGAEHALILTSGATVGVAMALLTARSHGDKLAIVGNGHKSVYNYARLFGYNITEVASILELCDLDITAAVITTPDYFGCTLDTTTTVNRDYILIIDGSHGAHFPFAQVLPALPEYDILISSFHKTLPVLTGGAGVLVNDSTLYRELLSSREILHSSSPSYLVMSSIDIAFHEFYSDSDRLYSDVVKAIYSFSDALPTGYRLAHSDDPTRVVVDCCGKDAAKIARHLEEKNNIYLEMTYEDKLVLIVTPYNYTHLITLSEALSAVGCVGDCEKIPTFCLEAARCDRAHERLIDICDSAGKVSMHNIGVYPPGVPIVRAGDIITAEVIDFITHTKHNIFGLIDGKISVRDIKE